MFFLVGPLRTGSSLLSRCIDDHPQAICLCESEINRTLFPPYAVALHFLRMERHGLRPYPMLQLLDRRRQGNVDDWAGWYAAVLPIVRDLYGKSDVRVLGDKSPDFFTAPALVDAIAGEKLIYTVRDPRSILRSIWHPRETSNDRLKAERWDLLKANIRCWQPHWDKANVHAVRYEDLVTRPAETMAGVYAHLDLAPSTRFLDDFERVAPKRFLWESAIDWKSGQAKPFDASRAAVTDAEIAPELRVRLADPEVRDFMERFGYGSDER